VQGLLEFHGDDRIWRLNAKSRHRFLSRRTGEAVVRPHCRNPSPAQTVDHELSIGGFAMPRGDKDKYTDKQKRKAEHIEEGYEKRGVSDKEAERRAWATVNKESGGGKKSGSGRGHKESHASSRKGGRKGGHASHAHH
jgi:plasmid stabilization system protein ParE